MRSILLTFFFSFPMIAWGQDYRTEIASQVMTRRDRPVIDCHYGPIYSEETFAKIVERRSKYKTDIIQESKDKKKAQKKKIEINGSDAYFEPYISEFFQFRSIKKILKSKFFIAHQSECNHNGLCFLNHVFNVLSGEVGIAERLLILRDVYGVNASYLSKADSVFDEVPEEIKSYVTLDLGRTSGEAVLPMKAQELDLLLEALSEMPPSIMEIITDSGSKPLRVLSVKGPLYDFETSSKLSAKMLPQSDGSYVMLMEQVKNPAITVYQLKAFIWMNLARVVYQKLKIQETEWSEAGFSEHENQCLTSVPNTPEVDFVNSFAAYRYAPYLFSSLGEKGLEARMKKYEMMQIIFNGEEYLSPETCHDAKSAETTNKETYIAGLVMDQIDTEGIFEDIDAESLIEKARAPLMEIMQHPTAIPLIGERILKTYEADYWLRKKYSETDATDRYLDLLRKEILETMAISADDSEYPILAQMRLDAEKEKFFLNREPIFNIGSPLTSTIHRKFIQYASDQYSQLFVEGFFGMLYSKIYQDDLGSAWVTMGKVVLKVSPVKTISQLMNGEQPGIAKWGEKAAMNVMKFFKIGDPEDYEDMDEEDEEKSIAESGGDASTGDDESSVEDDEDDEEADILENSDKKYSDELIEYFIIPALPSLYEITDELIELRKVDEDISDEENLVQLSVGSDLDFEYGSSEELQEEFKRNYGILEDRYKEKEEELNQARKMMAEERRGAFKDSKGKKKYSKKTKSQSEVATLQKDLEKIRELKRILHSIEALITTTEQGVKSRFYQSRLVGSLNGKDKKNKVSEDSKTVELPIEIGIVGDSWATGYNRNDPLLDSYADILTNTVPRLLAQDKGPVYNISKIEAEDGETSDHAIELIHKLLMDRPYTRMIILQLGGNDGLNLMNELSENPETKIDSAIAFDQIKRNLQGAIYEVTGQKKYLMLAKFKTVPGIEKTLQEHGVGDLATGFDNVYVELCKENQHNPYFYCINKFMHNLGPADYQVDMIHPNEAGHVKLAVNVYQALQDFYTRLTQNKKQKRTRSD